MSLFNALKIALVVAGVLWAGPLSAQDKAPTKDKSGDTQAGKKPTSSADAKATQAGSQKGEAGGTTDPAAKKADSSQKADVGKSATAISPAPSSGSLEPKPAGGEASKSTGASAGPTGGPSQPTTAAAPQTGAGGSTDSAQVDGSTYVVRMRDLAQRIDELKEQIRRSHTRLSLLSETILSGGAGGARAEINFTNDMSSAFRLVRALFVLDGAVQYNKQDDTGALAEQKSIPIFSGSIPPGDHTLQVLIKLQGYGYGVFSYLRGYKFEVKSTHSFTITEGKTMRIEVIAWEKGGVTTPLEQRPSIRYQQKVGTEAVGKPESSPVPGGSTQLKAGTSVGAGVGTP